MKKRNEFKKNRQPESVKILERMVEEISKQPPTEYELLVQKVSKFIDSIGKCSVEIIKDEFKVSDKDAENIMKTMYNTGMLDELKEKYIYW